MEYQPEEEILLCDLCGSDNKTGYIDDDLTEVRCEHCDVGGTTIYEEEDNFEEYYEIQYGNNFVEMDPPFKTMEEAIKFIIEEEEFLREEINQNISENELEEAEISIHYWCSEEGGLIEHCDTIENTFTKFKI